VPTSYPRPLNERERSVLDFLLSHDFPGVEALRVQAQSARVRGLGDELPTIVLLEVDVDAPFATEVAYTVPIDARVRDVEPPQEVLLFVKWGRLECIELVDYSLEEPHELPTPEGLETPTVYVPGREPAAARRRRP
jgi:hypothetical protein